MAVNEVDQDGLHYRIEMSTREMRDAMKRRMSDIETKIKHFEPITNMNLNSPSVKLNALNAPLGT